MNRQHARPAGSKVNVDSNYFYGLNEKEIAFIPCDSELQRPSFEMTNPFLYCPLWALEESRVLKNASLRNNPAGSGLGLIRNMLHTISTGPPLQ
jgi:hypothetical protein